MQILLFPLVDVRDTEVCMKPNKRPRARRWFGNGRYFSARRNADQDRAVLYVQRSAY